MLDPASLLASVRGTTFGPVRFSSSADEATWAGQVAALAVDGVTVVATVTSPCTGGALAAAEQRAAATSALLEVAARGEVLEVRCWAESCTSGAVATAARTAIVVAGDPGADAEARGGAEPTGAAPQQPAPRAAITDGGDVGLSEGVEAALVTIADACSAPLADLLRSLLLGEREQVTLARTQLDELTGAVLGEVTVFNVGTGSGGGANVNLLLPGGRVVDVQVDVDDEGIRVDPASEGVEVLAALQLIDAELGARGRRLARVAAAGDALVIATDLL